MPDQETSGWRRVNPINLKKSHRGPETMDTLALKWLVGANDRTPFSWINEAVIARLSCKEKSPAVFHGTAGPLLSLLHSSLGLGARSTAIATVRQGTRMVSERE